MKRTDSKRVPGALPTFLDQTPEHPAPVDRGSEHDTETTDDAAAHDADAQAEASDEAFADASDVTDAELAATFGDDANDGDGANESGDTSAATRAGAPPGASERRRGSPQSGGMLAMTLGAAVLALALATFLVPSLAELMTNQGIPANALFVLGTLVFAAGATQRHIGRLQQRLDETENRRQQDSHNVQQDLQRLVADQKGQHVPTGGEDLQHVLLSLQRQDEKINNLTKAIKMYGKPLMEITGQGTEFAGSLANVKTLVEGGAESMRQSLLRLETQLRAPTNSKELAELNANVLKLSSRVDAVANQKPQAVDLQPLQQHVGRLEVSVAAVAQRLDDKDVHKSLLRLEETSTKSRESLQELLRGDVVHKATTQLTERVEQATKRLADALSQLREGNLGGLEQGVRELQREMSGVATTVAQINAQVKNGTRTAAAAATSTSTATAIAAAPAATTATTTATADHKPAGTSAPAGSTPAADAAGYQTGARTTGSKNVLGAIAKLKQMKG